VKIYLLWGEKIYQKPRPTSPFFGRSLRACETIFLLRFLTERERLTQRGRFEERGNNPGSSSHVRDGKRQSVLQSSRIERGDDEREREAPRTIIPPLLLRENEDIAFVCYYRT
jgi:hypothetical protein